MERVTSLLLVCAVFILGASGGIMLYGSWMAWLFDLHRSAAFVFLLLLPFKLPVMYRSIMEFRRPDIRKLLLIASSILLALIVGVIVLSALMWSWRLGPYSTLKQTLITWHWIFGVASLPFFAIHIRWHWSLPYRQEGLSRRNVLRLLGIVGMGAILGRVANWMAEGQATPTSPRRFTGSRGFGLFSGNDYPSTGEPDVVIDPGQYRLVIDGAVEHALVLSYPQLLAIPPQVRTEAIDCHNGWFSLQDWQGLPLMGLLELAKAAPDAAGIRLTSASGLSNTYPMLEAYEILLATHSSGAVLDGAHGYPLRAVVPGRRGWFWLKWVVRVEVLLSPFEVAQGIMCTPLQVFRELPGPRVSTDVR